MKPPSWYDKGEKRTYSRAYRDGLARKHLDPDWSQPRTKWPNAYARGYWDGVDAASAQEKEGIKSCP